MKDFAFDSSVYLERRMELMKMLGSGKLLFLGNKEAGINYKDNCYPFRQDSSFLYYFGIDLPDLAVVIDIDNNRSLLFGDDPSIDHIVWTGPLTSLNELAERCGISEVLTYAKLADYVDSSTAYLPPYRGEHIVELQALTDRTTSQVEAGVSVPFLKAVVSQRSIKSSAELVQMDQAANLSHLMHKTVMSHCKAGMKEYELLGIAHKTALENDSCLSFPAIITTHGEILHNHNYSHTIEKGDMVLFDGGCESSGRYAGDITRTFPVNARFDSRQAEMYEIVYIAYSAAIDMLAPGIRYLDVHIKACEVLSAGLRDQGLILCSPEEAVQNGVHTLFFQCGLGHMLGLDVHDMENLGENYVGYTDILKRNPSFGFKSLRLARKLETGFVLTVEPGIYIIPHLIDLCKSRGMYKGLVDYKKLENFRDFGGIRIEDDFYIDTVGAKILGTPFGRTIEEVQEIRLQNQ